MKVHASELQGVAAGRHLSTGRLRQVSCEDPTLLEMASSDDPRIALDAIARLLDILDHDELRAVRKARDDGMSWESIATLLRRVRSSVWERYAKVVEPK